MRPSLAVSSLTAALLLSTVAHALPDEPAPDADEVRLREAMARLDRDEGVSKLWYFGWTAGFAGLVGGGLGLALASDDRDDRQEGALLASTASLGFLSTLLLPPTSAFAPARVRAMPSSTPAERAAKLAAAERALARAATEQRFAHGWVPRVASLTVNSASFLIRWFVFQHRDLAVVGVLPGLSVTEAKTLSLPTTASDSPLPPRAALVPLIAPGSLGLSAIGSF